MKCPKCNEEALFVNGKYVCVDCGIEITPEEQANQFSSNDLLDANTNVAGPNPITDPDPQAIQAFNTSVTDDQNQPSSTPDQGTFAAAPSVDEPTISEPAQQGAASEQADFIEPVVSESTQASIPEPTVSEAGSRVAESVETPTPDPVEPVMANPITPALDTTDPPITDQAVPSPSFNDAEIKKPVEEYYKSELENTDKPQDNATPGSGIYDFTADQNTEDNQVGSAPETPQVPEVQAMASGPIEVPLPRAEILVQSPVLPQVPLQSASDLPIEPVPSSVDPDINTEESQISETVPEFQPVAVSEAESVMPPVVPEIPMEQFEGNVQSESQVSELTGSEPQPQEATLNTPFDSGQAINESSTSPIAATLPTDGYTIPVQTEEVIQPAPEFSETSNEMNAQESLANDLAQPESQLDNSSQDQPYFQPSTFEMSTNNEDQGLNAEEPAPEFENKDSVLKNEESTTNSDAGQGTNFNEPFAPESVDMSTADLPPTTSIPEIDVQNESPMPSLETANIAEPDDNAFESQESPETQLAADTSISPEIQAPNSDIVGFSAADIKNEGPMPSVESVFGGGGDGDTPTPQDYGLPAPKPPNEKNKKMILVGSLVGGFILVAIILLIVLLSQPKDPAPIVLGAEEITTLSGNVTNTMDERQDIAVKYEVTANYENLVIKNPDSQKPDSQSKSYSASGDWLADKAGNIHVSSSINGLDNKQTYMAESAITFVFDEVNSEWKKTNGNKINSVPSYIGPNSRSSAVYAQNIQSISVVGLEDIGGVDASVYEITPSKSYTESANFLGPYFSSLSFVSLDSSNLNIKVWIGANDSKIYRLELSGSLFIESEKFSGEIALTTTANYEYRSVLISNPEETAKESPPQLMVFGYIFKTEDGKPSSVNERLVI